MPKVNKEKKELYIQKIKGLLTENPSISGRKVGKELDVSHPYATRLKNKAEKELAEEYKEDLRDFKSLLLTHIPPKEVVRQLRQLISDPKDKRSIDNGIQKWLNLMDQYPDKKVKVGVLDEIDRFFE